GPNKRALAAGIGEDACLPGGIGRCRPSDWTGCRRHVCTQLEVTGQQVRHALVVHDEHQQIGALTADLRSPAYAAELKWGRCTPRSAVHPAGGNPVPVFSADTERALDQFGYDGDALGAFENRVRNAVVTGV